MSAVPSPSGPVVAVVGATGAVGVELIRCLEQRRFPLAELRLFASARSAGKSLRFRGAAVPVRELTEASFEGGDIALFSAGGSTSRRFAPLAVRAGATVIDNTSAFRMDAQLPLVGPEINPQRIKGHGGIIANPNCCAIISITCPADPPGEPHRRLQLVTYQAPRAPALRRWRNCASPRALSRGTATRNGALPHPTLSTCSFHNARRSGQRLQRRGAQGHPETRKDLRRPGYPRVGHLRGTGAGPRHGHLPSSVNGR